MSSPNPEVPNLYTQPGYESVISEYSSDQHTTLIKTDETMTWCYPHPDGDLIVRTPGVQDPVESIAPNELFDIRVRALYRGIGVPLLEQMVAYSADPRTVVTLAVHGETLEHLSSEKVRTITDDHYTEFLNTVEFMKQRNLVLDHDSSNFIYDEAVGVTAIDYTCSEEDPWSRRATIAANYLLFLMNAVYEAEGNSDAEYRAAWLSSFKRGLGVVLQRYPHAIEELESPDDRAFVTTIDARLA